MFPPLLKVKGHGRVVGQSREGALCSVKNFFIFSARCAKLPEFIWSACGFIINNIEVRVGGRSNESFGIVFGPR